MRKKNSEADKALKRYRDKEPHHGFWINGAHVSCSKKPDEETLKALADMIERAKKLD